MKQVKKVKEKNFLHGENDKLKARQKRRNEKVKLNRLKQSFSGTGMRKKGLFKEANEKESAEKIQKKSSSNKKTLPTHVVIEGNNVEGFNSHEENQEFLSVDEGNNQVPSIFDATRVIQLGNSPSIIKNSRYFRIKMEDENEKATDERNQNKKLVKRGFLQPEISRYIRDEPSDNYNTNKHRMIRIMFLANQLARDAGVELLIFGYFPNVAVGSCGAWAFGEETKKIVMKPTAKSFLKHWENVFSLKDIRRGFLQPEISRYIRDDPSDNYNTNKHRMIRIMFLANQLARDAGVELLIFGYFPNVAVGSCGAWAFGEETKKIVTKPTAKSFLNYWENVFSLKEDIRQNPDKANVDVENEESQTENVELNKEEEVVGVHVSYTDSEGESVERSNKESFEPEQEQLPSHLITGTQHPPSTVTITLTQREDGTYLAPAHLIDQLDAWGLSVQQIIEIATESTSDRTGRTGRTGASNVAASELPVPVNGTKRTVPVQGPATTPVEFHTTLTPFGTTSTQNPATAISTEQPLTDISLKARTTSSESHVFPSGSPSDSTSGENAQTKGQASRLPAELTAMAASNPSLLPPVTSSETQVLISSPSPPVSVVTSRSETPELPTPETGQWGTENGVLASSDSASASIFNQQKRKKCVESETSTKKKRAVSKNVASTKQTQRKSTRTPKPKLFN